MSFLTSFICPFQETSSEVPNPKVKDDEEIITTASGEPVGNFTSSQTVGRRGPLVLQDHIFFNSVAHMNRTRIPERVAHARGAGAHGYFEVTHDITKYCAAKLFDDIGKRTPVFARFSTATGEIASADTRREQRGFALKFYTEEGNWDLVSNNIPIFSTGDGLNFSSSHNVSRRNPATNLRDPNAVWDFNSLSPSVVHQVLLNNSDRGIPDGYRFMHGFGVHAFLLVNDEGETCYAKFTYRTNQGIRNLTSQRAVEIAGTDPQYAARDLFTNIRDGNYPSWTFYIQVMTLEQVENWRMNPFDPTKVWPHREFPLIEVGQLVLNRNPENHFNETEQAAFSPANLVPGIRPSPDRVLAARMFAYSDTQRYRLGVNHEQLPINAPIKTPKNYLRGGLMNYVSQGAAPNYFPNSFGGPVESERARKLEKSFRACGEVKRHAGALDNFEQPREFWNRVLDEGHRRRTVVNIVSTLRFAMPQIQKRVIRLFSQVSPDMGDMIEEELRRQPQCFVAYIDDTASWLTIAPAIIFLVGLCFVPPSPRYLTITGKPHTAKKLLLLHRFNTATVRTDVDVWLGSKDVFDVGRLFDDMKYVKLFSPLLGLSLLELKMGPVVFLFYLQEICFYICESWTSAYVMSVVVCLTFSLSSFVAYKLHNCAAVRAYTVDTKNYKKLLYGALSLMAISLFAISGDVHYSKSSGGGGGTTSLTPGAEAVLLGMSLRKKAAAVALFCIFMVIYSLGVRPSVAALEDRFTASATIMYKAISTTTHWLAVPLLIHLFLLNWSHIGFGWILVLCATVCLLAITYVAVFIPEGEEEVTDDAPHGDNGDLSEIRGAAEAEEVTAV